MAVANNSFTVTYDLNYEGAPAAEQVETVKGEKAENKAVVRDGYTLVGWYVNPDFTAAWDFKTGVTEDTTLYALWTKDGAEYANVTFDYDFYGVKLDQVQLSRGSGRPRGEARGDPVRAGYSLRQVGERGRHRL